MPFHCFYNGQFMPADQACISIYDLGLLRGYAAFDYLRTHNGRPFRLQDHLNRLRNSSAALLLKISYSDVEIEKAIAKLIALSELEEAGIRFIVTGGVSRDSMSIGDENFIIMIDELPRYPESAYTEGVKLIAMEHLRTEPESKTTSYIEAVKMQKECKQAGAMDVLYTDHGEVLELSRNNFFVFKGETLITASSKVLKGITRKVVLELAEGIFSIEQRKLKISELEEIDEAFITGTSKGIVPVVQIDNSIVGTGTPGTNTMRLMEILEEYVNSW